MKKKIYFLCGLLLLLCIVSACAGGGVDANGNALISSRWELVSFTTKSAETVVGETPWYVRIFTDSMDPKFTAKDGVNCVFTLAKKKHVGTLEDLGDGKYRITYNDTSKPMFAEVSGNTLVIWNEEETLKFVFETNQN